MSSSTSSSNPPAPILSRKTKRADEDQDSVPLSSLSSSSPTNKRQKRHEETGIRVGHVFEGYDDSISNRRRTLGLFVVESMTAKSFLLRDIKCEHVKEENNTDCDHNPFNLSGRYFETREAVLPLVTNNRTYRCRFTTYNKKVRTCSGPGQALFFSRVLRDEGGKYRYNFLHHPFKQ